MRALFEVALIAIASSWKWLLGVLIAIGALIGILFGVGVLGGGGGAQEPGVLAPTPTPRPTARPTPTSRPTLAPTVVPGIRTATVELMATGADNVGSIEFVLVFDPEAVELTDVALAGLSESGLMETTTPGPGRLWAGIIAPDGITGDGALVSFTFDLKDGAEGDIGLSLEEVAVYNLETLVDIIAEATPGKISVAPLSVEAPALTFR